MHFRRWRSITILQVESRLAIFRRRCFIWVITDGDRVMLPFKKFKTVDLVSGRGGSNIKIFALLPSCLFLPSRDATIAEEDGRRLIEAS
jgi:hypothetical protein